jgi:hypothetical protein
MPILEFKCAKHGKFEMVVLSWGEAKDCSQAPCPTCKRHAPKEEFPLPAKFMGCYGENNSTPPAPSKRHSTKKMDKKGNS